MITNLENKHNITPGFPKTELIEMESESDFDIYNQTMENEIENINGNQQADEDAHTIIFPKYYSLEEFLPDSKILLEEYICFLCKGVYHEPYISGCGHIFCKNCILTQIDFFETCPLDNQKIEKDKVVHVQFLKILLDKQQIYCKNKSKNCDWKGNLGHLKSHLENQCEFRIINCVNSGCNYKGDKNETEKHKEKCLHRKFVCEFCKNEFKILNQEKHFEECEFKIYPCKNNCGLFLIKSEIKNHIENDCIEAEVACEFSHVGCLVYFKKKEKELHDEKNLKNHLKLLNKAFLDLNKKFIGSSKENNLLMIKNRNIEIEREIHSENNLNNKENLFVKKLNMESLNKEKQGNENNIFNRKDIFSTNNIYAKVTINNQTNLNQNQEGKGLSLTNERNMKNRVRTFSINSSDEEKKLKIQKNIENKNKIQKSKNNNDFASNESDNENTCNKNNNTSIKFKNNNSIINSIKKNHKDPGSISSDSPNLENKNTSVIKNKKNTYSVNNNLHNYSKVPPLIERVKAKYYSKSIY